MRAIRLLATTALITVGAVFLPAGSAAAAPIQFTIDGVTYSADSANPALGAMVVDDAGVIGTSLSLPASVTHASVSYAVNRVANYAFYGNSTVTTLTLPETVHLVGFAAFAETSIESVTLPDSLTSMGGAAFRASRIASVTIPPHLTTISSSAFALNPLTSVSFGAESTVATIGDGAFSDIPLTSIELPDSVTRIDNNAFSNSALEYVDLPPNLQQLGAGAFYANNLTGVTIPATLAAIADYTFDGNNLGSVELPSSLTSIGPAAFRGNQLTVVRIPEGVSSLGILAFDENPELRRVVFDGNRPSGLDSTSGTGPFGPRSPVTFYIRPASTGWDTPTTGGYKVRYWPTVTFDANGHGIAPESQLLVPGDSATEPDELVEEGWIFDGWFTAAEGGEAFDFDAPLDEDTTIYAQWRPVLANQTPPSITGDPRVDTELTADPGTWSVDDLDFTYQWNVDAEPVDGATSSTFTPRPGDLGRTMTVDVTASPDGYEPETATSDGVVVTAGLLDVADLPTLDARPRVGEPLTATPPGPGLPDDTVLTYAWFIGGERVVGVTGDTLVPGPEDQGKRVRLRVRATSPGYEPLGRRSKAGTVLLGTLTPTESPSLSTMNPRVGEPIVLDTGTWPVDVDFSITWYAKGIIIDGATDAAFTPDETHLGSRIWAAIVTTAPGYRPKTLETAKTTVVRRAAAGVQLN